MYFSRMFFSVRPGWPVRDVLRGLIAASPRPRTRERVPRVARLAFRPELFADVDRVLESAGYALFPSPRGIFEPSDSAGIGLAFRET